MCEQLQCIIEVTRDVRPWPWHLRPSPCHLPALNGNAKACRVTMPKDKSRLPPGRDVFEDSMVEAKARGLRGQGHKFLSSRSRPVFEDPDPCAFYRAMLRREQLCHVVCLSTTLKFSALLPPLVLVYEVLCLWY